MFKLIHFAFLKPKVKYLFFFALLITTYSNLFGQTRYTGKIEAGYLPYLNRTITVDPGPNWRGYKLDKEQNGIEISAVNGIGIKERLFIGIGVGYLNYEGIHGFSLYGDIEFLTSKKRLAPLLNFRAGHSKINNQYDNGSSSGTLEFDLGLNYKVSRLDLSIKAGIAFAYGASFTPLRIGIRL